MHGNKYTTYDIYSLIFLKSISYVRVDTEDPIKVHEFPWIMKIPGDISAYPYDIPSIPLCRVRTTVYACVRIYTPLPVALALFFASDLYRVASFRAFRSFIRTTLPRFPFPLVTVFKGNIVEQGERRYRAQHPSLPTRWYHSNHSVSEPIKISLIRIVRRTLASLTSLSRSNRLLPHTPSVSTISLGWNETRVDKRTFDQRGTARRDIYSAPDHFPCRETNQTTRSRTATGTYPSLGADFPPIDK